MTRFYRLAKPVLFRLDPERAHWLSLRALTFGVVPTGDIPTDPRLRRTVAGLSFPNPLGLAAGYDKNAEAPDGALRLGFGFIEVGTVTPQPQAGNPTPRVFRITGANAIINRLGFNNDGHAEVLERLNARRRKPGLVGVNIGANKDSRDRLADYVEGIHAFASIASYLTVNVSSPNTPGLRDFQSGKELDRLLSHVVAARNGAAALAGRNPTPLFLKVAPDLAADQVEEIAAAAKSSGIDGLIVANTTLSRTGVANLQDGREAGGLSGRPLMDRSTYVLAQFRRAVGPDFPLIGVGGVESAKTSLRKMEAGADLVQMYTALIYAGPQLPGRILRGMVRYLDKLGSDSIAAIRDSKVDEILSGPAPKP